MKIDTTFDFRTDTPEGKDPDTYSPTLAKYHHLLWNKALPSGEILELTTSRAPFYHYYKSDNPYSCLSGDAVIPSFRYLPHIRELESEEGVEAFETIGYTIGGMMVFPANQIDRKWTINQARGCYGKIKDRFDLTVECIRRFYLGIENPNPLYEVLERYRDFLELFQDFRGYAEFFHLQDIVTEDYSAVKFFLPFDNFESSPIPQDREAYHQHRILATEFLVARNQRIRDLDSERG